MAATCSIFGMEMSPWNCILVIGLQRAILLTQIKIFKYKCYCDILLWQIMATCLIGLWLIRTFSCFK